MIEFLKVLRDLGIPFDDKPLGELHVVDLPLPQRSTEALRFVFKDGEYVNHRIFKVKHEP